MLLRGRQLVMVLATSERLSRRRDVRGLVAAGLLRMGWGEDERLQVLGEDGRTRKMAVEVVVLSQLVLEEDALVVVMDE